MSSTDSSTGPAVSLENLSFAYPDGTPAVREVTLSMESGERVALIGPNGAGKSTLLLHMNGTLRGDGAARIMELPVEPANLRRIRSLVGLVFQDPDDQLFLTTVFDDVAFGPLNQGLPQDAVRRRVREALEVVDMTWATAKPAHHLSFGEKKRVSIATVIAMNPEILVLDEPTSNLDPRNRRRLEMLLSTFSHTLLIATHDLPFALRTCGRTVLMDNGTIAADGPTETLLGDPELMESHGLEAVPPR